MKVICAPDSFKGSMTAIEAAEAMAAGIRKAVPDAIIDCCPIADGGEGSLSVLLQAVAGQSQDQRVSGPLGKTIDARIATFAGGALAVVEAAAAIGLTLLPESERDPTKTSSRGVGELILAASRMSPAKIIVAIGGSSTNDGGCGMAQALGIRFLNEHGRQIDSPICGGSLQDIAAIDASQKSAALDDVEMIVACDVQNTLTGPDGATYVYAEQKGARLDQLPELDAGLRHLAKLIKRDLGIDVEDLPGSGAAGGLGGGLVAFAGATIASGIDTILQAVDFDERVRDCDLCLTGEGKIDAQSLSGKAVMGVARAAVKFGVPTVALVGATGPGAKRCLDSGLRQILRIGEGLPAEVSIREAATLAADAAGRVAQQYRRD